MRTPKETYEKYISVSLNKCQMKPAKTFLLAVFAGMFIALAGVASTFAGCYTNKVCGAVIFCGGLAMVLVAGSELFTGNCLLIMPLMDKKVKFSAAVKNWVIVYIGNFVGAIFVAALSVYSGALDAVSQSAFDISLNKTSLTFIEALLRGVLCNILVCIAAWMSFSSDKTGDKIIAVIFPVTFFVLCGFEHSVANMYFIPAGMMLNLKLSISGQGATLFGFLVKNLLPVTIGNLIGGVLIGAGYRFAYSRKTDK